MSEEPPYAPNETLSNEGIPYKEYEPRWATVQMPVARDRNFKSEKVVSVNAVNFDLVLGEMPAAMVMFYRPCDSSIKKYQETFSQASKCTKRENHVFAAVNCAQDEDVCIEQGVYKTPAYSLYSNGQRIGFFEDCEGMSAGLLRTYVEQAPVFPPNKKRQSYAKTQSGKPDSQHEQIKESSSFSSFYEK